MPRQPKPADIKIVNAQNGVPSGPSSSPMNLEGVDLSSFGGEFSQEADGDGDGPSRPQTPPLSPRALDRDTSKTFFGSLKTKKSPEELHRRERERFRRRGEHEEDVRPGTSSVSKIYHLRKAPGSTPELSLVTGPQDMHKGTHEVRKQQESEMPPSLPTQATQPTPQRDENSGAKKPTFKNPLARTKSINRRGSESQSKMNGAEGIDQPLVTAPLRPDVEWQGAQPRTNSRGRDQSRGKSAERQTSENNEESSQMVTTTGQPSNVSKNAIVVGGKNALSKAKTGGGHFFRSLASNNLFRRGSSNHSEKIQQVPDTDYEFRIINLPLIPQARLTRISKQTHLCKDKTEFWMPALPWRCIDYLNTKCEVEGLYRVPGSTPQIKRWQRRFDTELDVDILKEDTHEVNEIASMLKAWLRELPDDLLSPQQHRELAEKMEKENPNFRNFDLEQEAPQVLRDTLSELQPYNYYMLFAITCHLSLILKHKEQNRMDLQNLAICVCPCLRLERWLFNYLVGDWRGCWRGCLTEKPAEAIERQLWELANPEEAQRQALARSVAQQQSQADSIRRSLKSEAQSRGTDLFMPAIDDAASTEEWSASIASLSVASYSDSNYDAEANPAPFHESTNREVTKPVTYIPAGARVNPNGTLSSASTRRPATATPSFGNDESATSTICEAHSHIIHPPERLSHVRSQSNLIPTAASSENLARQF